jgi:uncharacterized protein YndB with AHSA1/START domain
MDGRSNAVVAEAPDRALMIERVLMIDRIFDAQRELVFKCWIEPGHLARWIGPQGFTSAILIWEPRPGGKYRIHKRGHDGQDHWQQGVFREIVPPERIVRTYCWTDAEGRPTRPETLLTLTFEDVDGRTRLRLHQAWFESISARDAHHSGWSTSLDQLAQYLAKIAPVH